MVYSHCRSDQLDHPDPLTFPIKPDQARLKGVYTTSSRPLVDHRRSIIPTCTRPLHVLDSTNWTSARSLPNLHRPDRDAIGYYSSTDRIQIGLRSDITREQIGYRSGCDRILLEYRSDTDRVKTFNPTKLDLYTNASRST